MIELYKFHDQNETNTLEDHNDKLTYSALLTWTVIKSMTLLPNTSGIQSQTSSRLLGAADSDQNKTS